MVYKMEYEKVLKSGKTVLIYEDVLTETKLEGKAVLVKKIQGGQIQRWLVQFITKDGTLDYMVERSIKSD